MKTKTRKVSGEALLKHFGLGLTVAFFHDEKTLNAFVDTLQNEECQYLREMGCEIVCVMGSPQDLVSMSEQELQSLGLYRVETKAKARATH